MKKHLISFTVLLLVFIPVFSFAASPDESQLGKLRRAYCAEDASGVITSSLSCGDQPFNCKTYKDNYDIGSFNENNKILSAACQPKSKMFTNYTDITWNGNLMTGTECKSDYNHPFLKKNSNGYRNFICIKSDEEKYRVYIKPLQQYFEKTAVEMLEGFTQECNKTEPLGIDAPIHFAPNSRWRTSLEAGAAADVEKAYKKCEDRCKKNINDSTHIVDINLAFADGNYKCTNPRCATGYRYDQKSKTCIPGQSYGAGDAQASGLVGAGSGQANRELVKTQSGPNKTRDLIKAGRENLAKNKGGKLKYPEDHNKNKDVKDEADAWREECKKQGLKITEDKVENGNRILSCSDPLQNQQKTNDKGKSNKDKPEYTGVVIDAETNKPIQNVQIAPGCDKTNSKGQFKCPLSDATVTISVPGKYEPKEVELKLKNNNVIKLKPIKQDVSIAAAGKKAKNATPTKEYPIKLIDAAGKTIPASEVDRIEVPTDCSSPSVTKVICPESVKTPEITIKFNNGKEHKVPLKTPGAETTIKVPTNVFNGSPDKTPEYTVVELVDKDGKPVIPDEVSGLPAGSKQEGNTVSIPTDSIPARITVNGKPVSVPKKGGETTVPADEDADASAAGVLPQQGRAKATGDLAVAPDDSGKDGAKGAASPRAKGAGNPDAASDDGDPEYTVVELVDGNKNPVNATPDQVDGLPQGSKIKGNKVYIPTDSIPARITVNGKKVPVPTNGGEVKVPADEDRNAAPQTESSDPANHSRSATPPAPSTGATEYQTPHYKGVVVNENGNPISGIKLSDNCITSTGGAFDCNKPKYNINKTGYSPASGELTPGDVNVITLTPSKYKGKVVDDKGKPIKGVEIVLGCKSDKNGLFNCPAPTTKNTVTVFHPGYNPETVKLDANTDNNIILKPKTDNDDKADDYEDEDYADDDDIKRENLARLQSDRNGLIPADVDLNLANKNTACKQRTVDEQIAIIYSTVAGPGRTVKYCKKFDTKKNDPDGKVQAALQWWKDTSSEWTNITDEGHKATEFNKQCGVEECTITSKEKEIPAKVNTTPGFTGIVVKKGSFETLPTATIAVMIDGKLNNKLSGTTDENGEFTIDSKLSSLTVDVSFAGLTPKRVTLKPNPEYNIIELESSEETNLEEQEVKSSCEKEDVQDRIDYIRTLAPVGAGKTIKYCKIHKDNQDLQSAVNDWETKNKDLISDDKTKKMEFPETESEDGQYIIVTCNETAIDPCDDQNPEVQHMCVPTDDNFDEDFQTILQAYRTKVEELKKKKCEEAAEQVQA